MLIKQVQPIISTDIQGQTFSSLSLPFSAVWSLRERTGRGCCMNVPHWVNGEDVWLRLEGQKVPRRFHPHFQWPLFSLYIMRQKVIHVTCIVHARQCRCCSENTLLQWGKPEFRSLLRTGLENEGSPESSSRADPLVAGEASGEISEAGFKMLRSCSNRVWKWTEALKVSHLASAVSALVASYHFLASWNLSGQLRKGLQMVW